MYEELKLSINPRLPLDPHVMEYRYNPFSECPMIPLEYTGWRNEVLSWKENCYIHNLFGMPVSHIKGSQARIFLEKYCVNNMKKFRPGTQKRIVCLSPQGHVITEGVMLCLEEDEFLLFTSPDTYLLYAEAEEKAKGEIVDFEMENIMDKMYIFQLSGPYARQIVEKVTGKDIGFLKHLHFCKGVIAGHEVRILNFGMGGVGSYEIHGPVEDGIEVYNTIFEAGKEFGITKLGHKAYMVGNHTENGFAQMSLHFLYAFEDLADWKPISERGKELLEQMKSFNNYWQLKGSFGKNINAAYRTISGIGADKSVALNHDFIGREAVEKELKNPTEKMVTLEWNASDVAKVFESYFTPNGEPYSYMELPYDPFYGYDGLYLYSDRVIDNEGKLVGVSSGRLYSVYYNSMISLCALKIDAAEIGNEVKVIFGNEGEKQIEIRATVARCPYWSQAK